MATLFDSGIFSVTDGTEPGSGWQLAWYEAGTATPTDTYTDDGLGTPNSNPVEADADGRFPSMWVGPGSYKYVLLDADSVVIKTQDDWTVPDAPPSFDSSLDNFLAGDAPLPIASGGTGQATAANAIAALGALPVAGGAMTGNLTKSTKGGFLHWNASGMSTGEAFIIATGDPNPAGWTSAGQILFKY